MRLTSTSKVIVSLICVLTLSGLFWPMCLSASVGSLSFGYQSQILRGSDINMEDYELSDEQKEYLLKWYPFALEEAVDHNIPWQIPIAQGILESGCGTTSVARNHHNHHGITKKSGGYQHFGTDEEGWRGYFDNIEATAVYSQNGIYETFDDPEACIDALVNAGYAEDTEYRQKLLRLLIGVEKFRLEAGLLTSAEYADKVETEAQEAWEEFVEKLQREAAEKAYQIELNNTLDQVYDRAISEQKNNCRSGAIVEIGCYMALYDYLNGMVV